MLKTENNTNPTAASSDAGTFFDNMVQMLRYDEQMFNNDLLDENKRILYQDMIEGKIENLHFLARETSSAYFVPKMFGTYFKNLISSKRTPKKLAVEFSESKILVWAEIFNEDEEMEDALILSQAKANAEYGKYGFHIFTTIVEENDGLEVPSHYKNIPVTHQ